MAEGLRLARQHWRGELETGLFAACIVLSDGLCLFAGLAADVALYIGDSRRDRSWTRDLPAAIANAGFAVLMGYGGKVASGGKNATSFSRGWEGMRIEYGDHAFRGDPAHKWDFGNTMILDGKRAFVGMILFVGTWPDPKPAPGA